MGKTLEIYATYVVPASDALLSLGSSTTQFKDLWITGTAYVDQFGEDTLFTGASQVQFRDTTTYIFSSAAGYLTLVSGTQIDLQANVGVSAKNFVFDTVTGVKIATATNEKLAFWNATPVVQATAITAAVGTITYTEPGTPDYAIQDLTQTTPYGFVTSDEAQTLLKVVVNIQSRLNEVITALTNCGILP